MLKHAFISLYQDAIKYSSSVFKSFWKAVFSSSILHISDRRLAIQAAELTTVGVKLGHRPHLGKRRCETFTGHESNDLRKMAS